MKIFASAVVCSLMLACLTSGLSDVAAVSVGINVDPTNPAGNASSAAVTTLGAKWVRIEFKESNPGSISSATWALYDAVVDDYHKGGVNILMIVDYTTLTTVPWGQTSCTPWTSYGSQLAARVKLISQRYSSSTVQAFEIWNEPDLKATHVPAACYAGLLSQVSSAIRGSSPNASTVLGGLASGNPQYVTDVENACPGKQLPVDAVALHPYGQRPEPNWPSPTWGFGYVGDLVSSYRSVTHHPLWISEVGTQDMTVQGEFPAKFFSSAHALKIPVTIWFCWSDGMVSPFGLVTALGSKKPSYYSYKNYTSP